MTQSKEKIRRSERVQVPHDPEALLEFVMDRGWGDGFPVLPPTPERVDALVAGSPQPGATVVGEVPPLWREATVEAIAVNAALAGCKPEYMPILIAAVRGVCDPAFNLYGIQATTNPCGVFVLVNGEIAPAVGMNALSGALGPGWRANATIGRAVRLVLMNVGGAKPWDLDRSTQGSPMKYSLCTAENEAESGWEPFHVSRGQPSGTSAVTVAAVQGVHNIIDLTGKTAEEALLVLAAGMAAFGTNNQTLGGEPFLALGPESAKLLSGEGLTRRDVQLFLFEHARISMRKAPERLRTLLKRRRPSWISFDDMPIADRPSDIRVFVCGGPGAHSLFLPTFGNTRAVTVPIGVEEPSADEQSKGVGTPGSGDASPEH